MLAPIIFLALSIFRSVFAASWTATPFNPASVPLAVRSPHLSAWLNQGSGTALNGDWPRFWTGSVRLHHRTLQSRTWLYSQSSHSDSRMGWLHQSRWNGLQLPWSPQCTEFVPCKGNPEEFLCELCRISTTIPSPDGIQFTSTQSTFVMTAGGIDLTVNFLSPVEVGSFIRLCRA